MSAFFTTVITIVVHTPIWVWPLYALLLFLGFKRTRDSTISLWRMLILPLVVMFLAILTSVNAGLGALPAVLLGLIAGSAVGWQLERRGATRRTPEGLVWLRGEWWTFSQIVLVLVFRYSTSVAAALEPSLNTDPTWHMGTTFISLTLSAMFLGRTAARLGVYCDRSWRGPSAAQ